jgi:hypothetical protein
MRADDAATRYWNPREAQLLAELRTLDEDVPVFRTGTALSSPHDGFGALCSWLLDVEPSPVPKAEPVGIPKASQAAAAHVVVPEQRRRRRAWGWRR